MGDEPSSMNAVSREQAVFAAALECGGPESRATFLDQACGSDKALRRRIDDLIRAAESAGDFLEQPPTGLGSEMDPSPLSCDLSEHAGDRIGRFKLLERIGEGGCGVVYMAEQEEPVRRRVALKVIKLGMDTRSVIARFEAERQALALMDHPNIAKVFDGGATQAGRPYFVMELVRGVRITEFCDEGRLSTQARLRLFIEVCQAVQHAHQKGLIHRDLKPSNILVTVNDGAPVPKVIDFGIAKATGQRLTDKTLFTHFDLFIGTPAYTSPEQAEMSSVDIDTRSDIYSLGVLLYELLTGKTPFDGEELLRSGLDEMRRVIREMEPPRPSTRLTNLVADAHWRRLANAQSIKTEPGRSIPCRPPPTKELISTVKGDLDWIVMKCLEKDRKRRYETANGLAMDIQRHLNSEPVMARSPSRMYLLQKLAQRNRGTLAAVAVAFAALLVAVGALAVGNARIREERNQKDRALTERSAALEAVRASEHRAREQLYVSLLSQAQARLHSGQMGQRLECLAALAEAARIRVTAELRDTAIAAMALPDIDRGPSWRIEAMAVAFDSLYQRSASTQPDGQVVVRSLPSNRELQRLKSSAGSSGLPGAAVAFSPDRRFLAKIEEDGQLWLRRCDNGKPVFSRPPERCGPIAFSPDGRQIAIGQEMSIACFDLETARERLRWPVLATPHMLRFDPEGRRVAVGYSQGSVVSIYDASDGRRVADLPVGEGTAEVIAWHPDGGLLAAAGSDPRIQIWNVERQLLVSMLESHAQQVTTLSFHPQGDLLVSVSWDCARLWQPSPGRLLMRLPLSGWTGFSADGQWSGVILPSMGQAQLWRIIPSEEYHTFLNTYASRVSEFHEGDINADGTLLALGASDGVHLWDVDQGSEVAWLPLDDTPVALFAADGHELLTCGPFDGLLRWRIAPNPSLQGGLQFGPPHVVSLPFAPTRVARGNDGRTLAVVGENPGQAVLLDLNSETLRLPDMPHELAGFVALSPGGDRLATSGWHSGQVKLWDGHSGQLLQDWALGVISRVFFTPDREELIVAREREFIFHSLKTLEISRRLPREIGLYPGHVAFSSDGKLMALEMAPGVIDLKETASGRTVAKLEDPQGDHSTWMCFTPDGAQLIVAASYAGIIHRWDLRAMRSRLKRMNIDWEWPELPSSSGKTHSSKRHPLHIESLGAKPIGKTLDAVPSPSAAKP